MSFSIQVPRRFHPGHSLLGRWIRARVSDARVAEGAFILAFSAILLVVTIGQYVAWAVLQPAMAADPTLLPIFWFAQLLAVVLFVAVCVAGWRPAIAIVVGDDALVVEERTRTTRIPLLGIERVARISYQTYYSHYRRYARTRSYLSPAADGDAVLVETPDFPIVFALPAEDREALIARLTDRVVAVPAVEAVRAA